MTSLRRKTLPLFLAIGAALSPAVITAATDAQTSPCGVRDSAAVADRHRQWILNWDRKTPGEHWDFDEKFGRFYDYEAKDMVLYDDFDPQLRVARSPDEYSEIWSPPFKALRTAYHVVIAEPEAIVGGALATSTLEFGARLEVADGSIVGIRTRSTLVWRCTHDGWRIVREHNSSRRITAEETQRLFAGAGQ
jgi:ketosteroid isomerase-like protein